MTWTLSSNEQTRNELREAANYYVLESPTLRAALLEAIDAALARHLAHSESAPAVTPAALGATPAPVGHGLPSRH